MPIISVQDNENNRWKRNAEKKTKTEKNKGDKSYCERVTTSFANIVRTTASTKKIIY